jgi:hypothetical protein
MYESLNQERVCVTFSVDDWAKVIASVATSRLELNEKEFLNSTIYDCVTKHEKVSP